MGSPGALAESERGGGGTVIRDQCFAQFTQKSLGVLPPPITQRCDYQRGIAPAGAESSLN
jgi:hypothetical protein